MKVNGRNHRYQLGGQSVKISPRRMQPMISVMVSDGGRGKQSIVVTERVAEVEQVAFRL